MNPGRTIVFATATAAAVLLNCPAAGGQVDNPYAHVDWDTWQTLHSMTHYHTGRSDTRRRQAYEMGHRHLAFSEYYPSAPTYPLPDQFVEEHSEAIGAPNAEHHSLIDHGLHFNAPGSWYVSGYGHRPSVDRDDPPIVYAFDDVRVFDADDRPWEGVYRLDLRIAGREEGDEPRITLSIDGAAECERRSFEIVGDGTVHERAYEGSVGSVWLRVTEPTVTVRLEFDASTTRLTQFRLMQGINRPWRNAFDAALDGDRVAADGTPIEGLVYPDGGGITINHPSNRSIDTYLEMLDHDERVLGIEVWNQHHWFGLEGDDPPLRYYRHWDDILRTGRRCLGFFVKDHTRTGRGRNVLLTPPLEQMDRAERERAALQAYRRGHFFGLLGALAVDAEGEPVMPFDHSEFRTRPDGHRGGGGRSRRGSPAAGANAVRHRRRRCQNR